MSNLCRRWLFAVVIFVATALAASAQTFQTLVKFSGRNGQGPVGGLIQGINGAFYGTAAEGGANSQGVIFATNAGGGVRVLYNFCTEPNCLDGADPQAGLILATDGNFYGTTLHGGTVSGDCPNCGTIFKITPNGTFKTLYSFCSQTHCADGYEPASNLIQASDFNFYGTASSGGTHNGGTIFRLTRGGAFEILY